MMKKGFFLTIEGVEGAGKSTAISFLKRLCNEHNFTPVVTREPGGTAIAEAIRQVLLAHYTETMSYETELLLMFASRAQHLAQIIKPALKAGQLVICDRFTDASYAYQGGGRGISLDKIRALEKLVQEDLQPDLTILLDVPVKLGLSRIKRRPVEDRIEAEQEAFFNRVREVYLKRAAEDPKRFKVLDASLSRYQIQDQLQDIMLNVLQQFPLTQKSD